ncbi:class I SAM-dependent methyltransferase [Corallococcus sp. AB050B]|nr:class I SAM-dependent methyltransferase [Corallococcus sp. AB050B]
MNGGYDDGYRSCPCFWGNSPGSMMPQLETLFSSLNTLSALDAGCGEGKNSAYLDSKGCKVFAFDVSKLAISNARNSFPNLKNTTFESKGVFDKSLRLDRYDIVVAYGMLHCLANKDEIEDAIRIFKAHTNPLGVHIICAFNSRRQELHAHPGFKPTCLEHSSYINMYRDYEIIFASDQDLTETHPNNGIEHTHSLTRIIARNKVQADSPRRP